MSTYSLKQGIEDGFLAPYRLRRILTSVDAQGYRPAPEDRDRAGQIIPDAQYETKDFEKVLSHTKRTEAIAKHLTAYLKSVGRYEKTIVFCVDQDHALAMQQALNNANSDIVAQYPDYVCRVTSDEEERGREKLDAFKDLETRTPTILTTSQMLTTGVDAPTCKHIVLARVINSMTEFKQIIGRGTRVREDYGKLFFTIHDYTGSASRLFADPEFDGYPAIITDLQVDEDGNVINSVTTIGGVEGDEAAEYLSAGDGPEDNLEEDSMQENGEEDGEAGGRRKIYFDGGSAHVLLTSTQDLDATGKLVTTELRSHTAQEMRTLYTSQDEIRTKWADPVQRKTIITTLEEHGIQFAALQEEMQQPAADPLDLLCFLAFDKPLRTRKERADYVRKQKQDFFDQYGEKARQVLEALLQKYEEHGPDDFTIPDVFHVPPFRELGNTREIAGLFGGILEMKTAIEQLQHFVYAE